MRRAEPPPIATWMLEHCAVGDCNEALTGSAKATLPVFRTAGTGVRCSRPVPSHGQRVFAYAHPC